MENNELDFSWATTVNPEREKRIQSEMLLEKERDEFIDKILYEFDKEETKAEVQEVKHNVRAKPVQKFNVKRKNKLKKIIVSANITVVSILAITLLSSHKTEASKIKLEKLASDLENNPKIESMVDTGVTLVDNSKDEVFSNYVDNIYRSINLEMSDAANRYLTLIDYDKIIVPFRDYIEKYSNEYGVDPNVIAGMILVESPDYDISNDRDFNKIGLGQYKGEYFDNEVFKAYNFVTGQNDSFVFRAEELYQNPEEQIKFLCMDVANTSTMYDYNLVAMFEHHNKGYGSVQSVLEKIKNEYGYDSKKSVLENADPDLIIKNINNIGDPNYSYKVLSCANLCLENSEFGYSDCVKFKNAKTNEEVNINIEPISHKRA